MNDSFTPDEIAAYVRRTATPDELRRIGERVQNSPACAAQLAAARGLTAPVERLAAGETPEAEADDLRAYDAALRREREMQSLPGLAVALAPNRAPSPAPLRFVWLPVVGATVAATVLWLGFVAPAQTEIARLRDAATPPAPVVAAPPNPQINARFVEAETRRRAAERKLLAANTVRAKAEGQTKTLLARIDASNRAATKTQSERDGLQKTVAALRARLVAAQAVPKPQALPGAIVADPRWVGASRGETPVYPVATAVPTLTPTLRWNSVAGAANYRVTVRDSAGAKDTLNVLVPATPGDAAPGYTVSEPLLPGAAYQWRVVALGANSGELGAEAEARFTVPTRAALNTLGASLLAAGAVADGAATLRSVAATGTSNDADTKAATALLSKLPKP